VLPQHKIAVSSHATGAQRKIFVAQGPMEQTELSLLSLLALCGYFLRQNLVDTTLVLRTL